MLALINDVLDRKSTRLNSSHLVISYAVFCLKKKKIMEHNRLLDTAGEGGDDVSRSRAAAQTHHLSPPCLRKNPLECRPRNNSFFFFLNEAAPTEFSPLPHPAPLPI